MSNISKLIKQAFSKYTRKEELETVFNELNTGETVDSKQLIMQVLDTVYPVGSIYITITAVCPLEALGVGIWQKIENRFLLSSGARAVGEVGGEETHKLTVEETPAHTHTRGTMDITGEVTIQSPWTGASESGALKTTAVTRNSVGGTYNQSITDKLILTASNNWTGATSSVGGNGAHNNMPPYLVVNIFKRIS